MAVATISKMLDNRDELFVITARPVRFKQRVEGWLKHHLNTDKIKVIHAGDFHRG